MDFKAWSMMMFLYNKIQFPLFFIVGILIIVFAAAYFYRPNEISKVYFLVPK